MNQYLDLFYVKHLNLRLILTTICANYCKLENYKSVEIFNLTFVGIGPKPADGWVVVDWAQLYTSRANL